MDDRDWCVSAHHEQRVIAALQKVADPTPAKVRKTLNGLGYTDERIHHLKQDGKKTRFHLDLREDGGRLCESGLAAGGGIGRGPVRGGRRGTVRGHVGGTAVTPAGPAPARARRIPDGARHLAVMG